MNRWIAQRSGILSFALSAAACDPGGPTEPEPVQVPVKLTASEAAGITGPIRLAVVWRQGTGASQRWFSTFDKALATVPESTDVWFDLPAASQRSTLTDVTRAYVSCDEEGEHPIRLSAAVPRLVAYEDRDQSGDFDPELPLSSGSDRVLAVNPSSSASTYIAGFTNLDAVLAQIPMEYAECIRTYTGGRYSAFVKANDYSDYAWAVSTSLSATLELSPNAYAAVAMACDPSDVYFMTNQASIIDRERATLADGRLDPDPCTNAPWQCSRADASTLAIPDPALPTAYPGLSKYMLCTAVGDLDILWLVTETIDCIGCSCDWLHSHQSWVVDAAHPPATWPCGKQVRYCHPRKLSVWELPEYCNSVSLERPE